MLALLSKHEGAPPEILDRTRRRLCAHTLSATSEHAFSNVGLIMNKKKERLMADLVDFISLMRWHYRENGRGEVAKRLRCAAILE